VSRRTWALVLAVAALAALARALAFQGTSLYTDEAYYWLWSTRPAAGYFDHPPAVAWLIWLSSRVLPGELGVRLAFVVLGGLTVLFAALAARDLAGGERAPVLGALLAAGAPMLHLAGLMALPDGPVTAGYAAATWLLCRARGTRWLWAGVAVGAALLGKYTAALLAPALLLLVLWDRELREELATPWPWLGGATAVVVFAPNLLWNAAHDWLAIGFQLHHGFRSGATLRSFGEFVGAQAGGAGPVAMVAAVAAALRARTSAEKRVVAAVFLPLLVTIYSATRGQSEANWAVHVFPGAAALGGAWLSRRSPRAALGWAGGQAALGAAALLLLGVELRHPRLLRGSVVVARFHAGRGLGEGALEAAEGACGEMGWAPGCSRGTFVYPSSFQYAGHLAYYAGWTRLGPAEERRSQLDLWNDRPAVGERFLHAGQHGGPVGLLRGVRAEGQGPTWRFDVLYDGVKVRTGAVTPFARYLGGRPVTERPDPGRRLDTPAPRP
jgi:4-amino-4-deoxy-L-arabinose transferase-like glycosyltransferase